MLSTCPRCQHPAQDQDRLTGVESAEDDLDGAGLYSCGFCSLMYVLAADGSTAEATFED